MRVVGPVTTGDVLVPSGRDDGVAAVMDPRQRARVLEECACASIQDAVIKGSNHASVAVALTSCATVGETMVECVVTPPAMTRDVVSNLKGMPRVRSIRRLCSGAIVSLVVSMMLLVCAFGPPASRVHSVPFEPSSLADRDVAPPLHELVPKPTLAPSPGLGYFCCRSFLIRPRKCSTLVNTAVRGHTALQIPVLLPAL